ncbi:hypothetical protein J3A83DRAFT_4198132 [Scleroderma citrinum]
MRQTEECPTPSAGVTSVASDVISTDNASGVCLSNIAVPSMMASLPPVGNMTGIPHISTKCCIMTRVPYRKPLIKGGNVMSCNRRFMVLRVQTFKSDIASHMGGSVMGNLLPALKEVARHRTAAARYLAGTFSGLAQLQEAMELLRSLATDVGLVGLILPWKLAITGGVHYYLPASDSGQQETLGYRTGCLERASSGYARKNET